MDKDHVSDYNRQYYLRHREEIAIRRANQRNEPKGAIHLDLSVWDKIKIEQNGKCINCGKATIDLMPFLSLSGLYKDLYVGVCKRCGSSMALDMANNVHQTRKEAKLEEAAKEFE